MDKGCRCVRDKEPKLEDGEASHTLGGAGAGGREKGAGDPATLMLDTLIGLQVKKSILSQQNKKRREAGEKMSR